MTFALAPQSSFLTAAHALIAAKRSPHTRTAYEADLKLWLAYCGLASVDPSRAALEHATRFRDGLLAYRATSSVTRTLTALSSLYRKLLPAGVVTSNPFHAAILARPIVSSLGQTKAVSTDDAERMIAAAQASPRDFALLRLLWDTGLRRASVAQLKRAAIQHVGERLVLRVSLKGGREGEVFLPLACTEALLAWLKKAPKSEWVFPGRDGPINDTTVNKLVYKWATEVGAEGVHPHSFRAAFVTSAYDAGISEHEIQASVHHTDPETTRRYDRGSRGTEVAEKVAETRRKK